MRPTPERCDGCGAARVPAVFFVPEDHLPIRVNGCLPKTYEQLLAEIDALKQERDEAREYAEGRKLVAVSYSELYDKAKSELTAAKEEIERLKEEREKRL